MQDHIGDTVGLHAFGVLVLLQVLYVCGWFGSFLCFKIFSTRCKKKKNSTVILSWSKPNETRDSEKIDLELVLGSCKLLLQLASVSKCSAVQYVQYSSTSTGL